MSKFTKMAGFICVAQLLAGTAMASDTTAVSPDRGFAAGDVLVRLRGLAVLPDERSSVSVIGGKVQASNNVVPEADFTYFATDKISFELIAAVTKHSNTAVGTSLGNVDLGSVWLLPPTLTAQYHFNLSPKLDCYAGAGINYTHMFSRGLPAATVTAIHYSDTVGPALQLGADYNLGNNWFANFDVKKIWMKTNVNINNGAILAHVHIDPWVVGAGAGYRF